MRLGAMPGEGQGAGVEGRGKLTNGHGLHQGDFQSPPDVVGSYSQVGATVGYIGLRFDPIPSCDLQATSG